MLRSSAANAGVSASEHCTNITAVLNGTYRERIESVPRVELRCTDADAKHGYLLSSSAKLRLGFIVALRRHDDMVWNTHWRDGVSSSTPAR